MSTQQQILSALLDGKTLRAVDSHSLFKCQENTFVRSIHYIRNGVQQDKAYPVKSCLVERDGKQFSQYWLDPDRPKWYEGYIQAKESYERVGKTDHVEYRKICEYLKIKGY